MTNDQTDQLVNSFTASLRIFHPTKSQDEIASKIVLDLKVGHTVGSQRKTPKGSLLEGVYKQTYCSFLLQEKVHGNFEDYLPDFSSCIKVNSNELKLINNTGGRVEIFIGIFGENDSGFTLKPVFSQLLAEHDIDLSIIFYT